MLRMLVEASASGLLHTLRIDPFNRKDMLHLQHVLNRLRDERYRRYSERELLIALVHKLCMAIGNREAYPEANKESWEILDYLRKLDLPDHKTESHKDAVQSIIDLWVQTFGDPEEMERQQAMRDALAGIGESEEARLARERLEFVRTHFLR